MGVPAEVRKAALGTLACLVNEQAGVSLAQVIHDDPNHQPYALVRRGTTPCDVSVTVTVDQDPNAPLRLVYQLAAFTEIGWAYYGDPFTTRQASTGGEAIDLITQYVPLTPTH